VEDVLGEPQHGREVSFTEDSEIPPELLAEFKKGEIGYNDFIDALHDQ
jgi:hypothetical protein